MWGGRPANLMQMHPQGERKSHWQHLIFRTPTDTQADRQTVGLPWVPTAAMFAGSVKRSGSAQRSCCRGTVRDSEMFKHRYGISQRRPRGSMNFYLPFRPKAQTHLRRWGPLEKQEASLLLKRRPLVISIFIRCYQGREGNSVEQHF